MIHRALCFYPSLWTLEFGKATVVGGQWALTILPQCPVKYLRMYVSCKETHLSLIGYYHKRTHHRCTRIGIKLSENLEQWPGQAGRQAGG